jgi:hypothetical protein
VAVAAAVRDGQCIAFCGAEAARRQVRLRAPREFTTLARPAHGIGGVRTLFKEFLHQGVHLLDFLRLRLRGGHITRGDVPLQVLAAVVDALHPVVEIQDAVRHGHAREQNGHACKNCRPLAGLHSGGL